METYFDRVSQKLRLTEEVLKRCTVTQHHCAERLTNPQNRLGLALRVRVSVRVRVTVRVNKVRVVRVRVRVSFFGVSVFVTPN